MTRFFLILLIISTISCRYAMKDACPEQVGQFYNSLTYSPDVRPLISAHRGGGDYRGYPENCLESFEFIMKSDPVLIECDVRRTADHEMILMHDESLDRTTNGTGKVGSKTWNYISKLKLKDNKGRLTDYSVPTLDQTLEWIRGKGVLTLDIKRGVDYADVIQMVHKKGVLDNCVIITYDIKAAKRIYELDPCIKISVNIRNFQELDWASSSGIPYENMIAFTGTIESSPDLYKAIHDKGMLTILGTLGNLDRRAERQGDHIYLDFIRKGIDILATDRPLEVAEVIRRD